MSRRIACTGFLCGCARRYLVHCIVCTVSRFGDARRCLIPRIACTWKEVGVLETEHGAVKVEALCVHILLYRCSLIPQLYMCPHRSEAAVLETEHAVKVVSSYYYTCVFILLHMCPHTTYYICVLILLYMCFHTTIYVSSYYYISIYLASPYYYISSVRILYM